MRAFTIPAFAAAVIISTAAGPAAAQHEHPAVPDSVRPQDTEPSIPVATPVIQPRSGTEGDPASGAAPVRTTDPNSPVPSRDDPSSAPAGDADPSAEAAAAADTGGGVIGEPALGQATTQPYVGGLPERTAPPRTLRAHWHVFGAFAIVWALLFGYALSIGRRFGRLEDEVRRLREPVP